MNFFEKTLFFLIFSNFSNFKNFPIYRQRTWHYWRIRHLWKKLSFYTHSTANLPHLMIFENFQFFRKIPSFFKKILTILRYLTISGTSNLKYGTIWWKTWIIEKANAEHQVKKMPLNELFSSHYKYIANFFLKLFKFTISIKEKIWFEKRFDCMFNKTAWYHQQIYRLEILVKMLSLRKSFVYENTLFVHRFFWIFHL